MNKFMILGVFLCSCYLSACSSSKLVKAYSGDELPETQVVKLSVGDDLQIVRVNGEAVQEYLLGSLNLDYALKPGNNNVVFQYESVWAQSSVGDDGKKAALVLSDLREIEFIASAGDKVSFVYPSASNVRDARKLAKDFDAEVINQRGEVLAKSGDLSLAPASALLSKEDDSEERNAFAPVKPVDAAQEQIESLDSEANLPKIEAMKVLWVEMSAQEQKEFLKWAFQ